MNLLSNFNTYEFYLIVYIAFINTITFFIFWLDKNKARNRQTRISESFLILLSIIGGSIGGLISMVVFKHKTSKKKFYIGIPLIIIFNNIIKLIILNYIK